MVSALGIRLVRSLLALRMQGLSIAMVVAAGVAAYVASMSTHESLKLARDQRYAATQFPDLFVDLTRAPIAVAGAIERLPGVSAVRHGLAWHARLDIAEIDDPLSARVMSLPDPDSIARLTLIEGHWPASGSREALLGESFAKRRGIRPGQVIGVVMQGRTETLVVTGLASSPEYILGAAHGGMSDDRSFGLIWMDRKRMARAIDLDDAFKTLALTLETGADRTATLTEIDLRLAPYGGGGAYGREDQFSNRALSQEIAEQRVFATVLPAIFLAVSIFVLYIVLSRRVSTERDQIATLRALGYGGMAIGSHYLLIAIAIAALEATAGIALGARLGLWLTELYTGYFRFPEFSWVLPIKVAALPTGLALLGAAAAGAMPVRTVLKCSPAEAMQPPAPTTWRRGPGGPDRLCSSDCGGSDLQQRPDCVVRARWELATLRVLGMTEQEVSRLLLGELALQTLIAMPIGCVAGWALAHLLVSMMSGGPFTIPVVIWPRTYVWAVASALPTGLLSAWLVHRRLAGLDLIAVLKVRE